MIGMDKCVLGFGALCVCAVMSGCTTPEANLVPQASTVPQASSSIPQETPSVVPQEAPSTVPQEAPSAAAVSTESVVVSMPSETTVVAPPPPPQMVDILQDVKKPCGTVAADAPKFVKPETK